jgi:outer membrane protein assembly factor BamB
MRNKLRPVWIGFACCGLICGADWLTDGGNQQRTAWQQDEHILSKDNVKDLKILWKIQLDNVPRDMHSLFAPLIVDNVATSKGSKQIAIETGASDNLYAIDVETGTLLWQKHFQYPPITAGRGLRPGDPLCPGGQTATPIIGPADASGARRVYALAGNGELHTLNVADGEDLEPPYAFSFPNGKSYALNMWHRTLFTTTSQSCNGNPNQIWAVNIDDPTHKVMTYNPKSGGLWGRTGAAIDSNGVAWAPTGDGHYDKAAQTYGNGLVGAKVIDGELHLEDYYMPLNWSWLQKRDLDFQVTPAIFPFKGRELMTTASKECRVYLLSTTDTGGEDHQTPLYRTPLLCNEEVNFAGTGIWGSMASWADAQQNRWVLTPFWGPSHSKFKVPISYGPVENGAIIAFKVEEKGGNYSLDPVWMSRDMNRAEPPVVANGVVYAYGSGENTDQAYPDKGLADLSPLRIAHSTHATLYALDALTGKELYSSRDQIKSFNHFSGLSIANGRVYIATYDSVLYCFGLSGTSSGQ